VAAAVVLAGCNAPSDPAEAGDGVDVEGLDGLALEATATTGVLRGVVVDEAIRPVANASVTARGPGDERTATTAADGLFGFAGLAPGTWFVSVGKVAYEEAQVSTEVVAGVAEPAVVKVLLVYIPGEAPFLTEVHVEAFIQCIVPGANMCAIINLYPCIVAGYCEPIVDDTSFVVLHDEVVSLQRVPDWLQTEILWESTQAATPGLGIQYSNYDAESPGRGESSDTVRGRSPLVYAKDAEALADWEVGLAKGIGHEIFGHMDETSAVGSIGFVVNQRVTYFFHAFYGYVPPEGWIFSADGAVPAPPR
jgi:Carboxypeptidase regulatory-like domain